LLASKDRLQVDLDAEHGGLGFDSVNGASVQPSRGYWFSAMRSGSHNLYQYRRRRAPTSAAGSHCAVTSTDTWIARDHGTLMLPNRY
jgi:hypothetical protein